MKIWVNLFEEQFNKVATNEGIELKKEYEPGFSKLNTYYPVEYYSVDPQDDLYVKKLGLDIPYRKHIIKVEYNVGYAKTANFHCEFDNGKEIENFKINYRSQYVRLLFKKNILKVNTIDANLKSFLASKLIENKLEFIARESMFTPEIEWNRLKSNKLKAHFSLSFENKKEVLEPMINFYKDLIDLTLD